MRPAYVQFDRPVISAEAYKHHETKTSKTETLQRKITIPYNTFNIQACQFHPIEKFSIELLADRYSDGLSTKQM